MEREFQSMYGFGEYSSEDPYFTGLSLQPFVNLNNESALLRPMPESFTSGLSLQPLVNLDHDRAVLHSTPSSFTSGDHYLSDHRKMKSYDFMETEPSSSSSRFKIPKFEPSSPPLPESPFPYQFASPEASAPVPNTFCIPISNTYYSNTFTQLPDLRSFEHVNEYDLAVAESSLSRKRSKSLSLDLPLPSPSPTTTVTDAYVLESLFRSFENVPTPLPPQLNPFPSPSPSPSTTLAKNKQVDVARRRRYSLSEKTRSLQKLLPWNTKMDAATMFEETHKYIKFLQAQVRVLQSMPKNAVDGAGAGNANEYGSIIDYYGELGRLNRQQLLQVMVNSPAAQTVMYTKGFCVYSSEQLNSLKKIAGRKLLMYNNPSVLH